jgi:hypothetical protein
MARPPINAKGELLFRQQLNAALDYVEDNAGAPGSGSFVLDDGTATTGGTFTIDEGGA